MNMQKSIDLLSGYERVASRPVISQIEKLLRVDSVQTGVSSLSTGLPSIISLLGLGKDIWQNQEAQDYVRKLRDEWQD